MKYINPARRLHYRELTKEQKAIICNGCGAKGGWVRPPHKVFFKASCDQHDFYYWRGGGWREKIRKDWQFYVCMAMDAMQAKTFAKRSYYSLWAAAYFAAVLWCGRKAFNFTKTPRTMWDVLQLTGGEVS